jgi:SAM-dependent methyltransferase
MKTNNKPEDIAWWEELYDDLLADILLENTNENEIAETVHFLIEALDLGPGASVFDQCCGTGRLSIPLARKGYSVTGVDLIESYIERSRQKNDVAGLNARFHVGDAFEFKCDALCDGGFNWWTSFGYKISDLENVKMLQRARDSLQPGAAFALDYMNVPGVLKHFKPAVVTEGFERSGARLQLIRKSRCDLELGVLHKEWNYQLDNGQQVQHHSMVRLYDPPALKRLFEIAGFTNIRVFGDLDSSSITLNSPRCIVVGQLSN